MFTLKVDMFRWKITQMKENMCFLRDSNKIQKRRSETLVAQLHSGGIRLK